jgi:hypothetical protein
MRIHHVFHVSLLELYHASTILGRIHDPPPPIEVDHEHEHEHEMDNIFYSRISNRQLQYLLYSHRYDVNECIGNYHEPIQ